MHVEQVEIVAKNQYLKIKILKQSKIRALESGSLECQNGQRILGHAVRHLTRQENRIPTAGLVVLTGRLRTDFQGLLIWGFSKQKIND